MRRCLTWSCAVVFCAAVFTSFAAAAEKDAKDAKASTDTKAKDAKSKDPWTSLFDGKTLGKWKKSEFGQGGAEVEDGMIVIAQADGCSGITYKGDDFPKLDYEIVVEAQRLDGRDFFCGLTFPVGKDPCSLIVGGWGGGLVGLSSIDGNDAANNDTSKHHDFKDKKWYTIRCRVTAKRISAWIGDEKEVEKLVDRHLEGNKIGIRGEVEASKPLGIATWNTTAGIRAIKWRPLTKDEVTESNKTDEEREKEAKK